MKKSKLIVRLTAELLDAQHEIKTLRGYLRRTRGSGPVSRRTAHPIDRDRHPMDVPPESIVPPGPHDHRVKFTSSSGAEPKFGVGELIDLGNFQGVVTAQLGGNRYAIEWIGESPEFLRANTGDELELAYDIPESKYVAGDRVDVECHVAPVGNTVQSVVTIVSKQIQKTDGLAMYNRQVMFGAPIWVYIGLADKASVPVVFLERESEVKKLVGKSKTIPIGAGVYNSHRGRGLVNNHDANNASEVAVKWFDWTSPAGERIEWCNVPALERMSHWLPIGARVHVPRNVRRVTNGQFDKGYSGGTLLRYENDHEVTVNWDDREAQQKTLFLSLLAPGEQDWEEPVHLDHEPPAAALIDEKAVQATLRRESSVRYSHSFPTPPPASPTEEAPETWELGDVVFVDGRDRGRIRAYSSTPAKATVALDRGVTLTEVSVSRLSRHTEDMPIYDETHEEYNNP